MASKNKKIIALSLLILLFSLLAFLFFKNDKTKNNEKILSITNQETGLTFNYNLKNSKGLSKELVIYGLFNIKEYGINKKEYEKIEEDIKDYLKKQKIQQDEIIGINKNKIFGYIDKKNNLYNYDLILILRKFNLKIKIIKNLITDNITTKINHDVNRQQFCYINLDSDFVTFLNSLLDNIY